ncbi:hypothetical protein ACIRD6_05005 [Streptomyces sp. NPDC102473]|uniref:hypothetical protein n=1 Tax=Streptomyces sp. NPDC102473 TaxID=3366180 RepID=UPI0037F248EC
MHGRDEAPAEAVAKRIRGDTWDEIEPHVVGNLAPDDSGRVGRPRDYAGMVTYPAGPGAGHINGTTPRVVGGRRGA